jgi:hypothetical protein
MRLPRRIADILKRKQEFIDGQRSKMESSVVRLQSELFNNIIAEIVPELDIKDGIIQDTAKNYRLISKLDKTYKAFQVSASGLILNQVVFTTAKIADLSKTYFEIILSGNLPERFDLIVEKANKLINLKIGLDGGKFLRGGFLQSVFESNTIGVELKQMTSKAVTSNMDMKDYVKLLKEKVTGSKDYTGSLERQFQRYGYDLYQQYDRAYNLSLGNEFGFTYFIYQGGLIKDSREFCVEHNNKVYSIEEAQTWCDWVSPTTGESPTYMCYPGYDPMIDMGGYNCRHAAGWIDDELAFKMRPELKEQASE